MVERIFRGKVGKVLYMSISNKKAWLNRINNSSLIIKADLKEIQKLSILINTGLGIGHSGTEAIKTLDKIRQDYNKRVNLQIQIEREIISKIEKIENEKEKNIIILRHINSMQWPDISEKLFISKTQCQRLYRKVLQKIKI